MHSICGYQVLGAERDVKADVTLESLLGDPEKGSVGVCAGHGGALLAKRKGIGTCERPLPAPLDLAYEADPSRARKRVASDQIDLDGVRAIPEAADMSRCSEALVWEHALERR